MRSDPQPVWLLIPAKAPQFAKSRLAPILSPDSRAKLAHALLHRLLDVAAAWIAPQRTVVVSGDRALREVAASRGCHALPDPRVGLNPALEAARAYAVARGASAVLVLPTDLPHLSRATLGTFLQHAFAEENQLLITRDQYGRGTNALWIRPACAIPFHFGPDSAVRHCVAAHRRGLRVRELWLPEIAFDLDLPQDWQHLPPDLLRDLGDHASNVPSPRQP